MTWYKTYTVQNITWYETYTLQNITCYFYDLCKTILKMEIHVWRCFVLGKIVSFQPVVYYNQLFLGMIGVVAFITQLQLLHLLRYNKTISILGQTLQSALTDLISFGFFMGILFVAFACPIYLQYHDLIQYSTIANTMGSQVRIENVNYHYHS